MALNPYINSFDTEADYDVFLEGSTAKAPNVAYIRATDTMKYTKAVPNPTWIIYGTTSGTTDFYIGASTEWQASSASNGIHIHVNEGIFYATADDVVGTIKHFTGNKSSFNTTEGKKITKISRFAYPTTDIINMSSMFSNCSNLTRIDLSTFDTSNVTNMGSMFNELQSLTSLDVSNFDTSNVTNMNWMFFKCSSLTSLNLSNFNTTNNTGMREMFYGCSSLTTLDMSNFDTTNVTDMTNMFAGCSAINKLILGSGFFNSTSFDFHDLSAWTDADSLETFVQAAEVHDGTGKTIRLSNNTKNALTQAQKDRITGAGWAITTA